MDLKLTTKVSDRCIECAFIMLCRGPYKASDKIEEAELAHMTKGFDSQNIGLLFGKKIGDLQSSDEEDYSDKYSMDESIKGSPEIKTQVVDSPASIKESVNESVKEDSVKEESVVDEKVSSERYSDFEDEEIVSEVK